MCSVRVPKSVHFIRYPDLIVLFLIQGAAGAIWLVPLSNVLNTHGLHAIQPFAFATTALACFVSPLIFGAVADRHVSPVKVLRGLAMATSAAIALVSTAIQHGANPWLVLILIQLYALCATPTSSIATTIIFERLADARKEFGQIRAMFTFGWIAGCWIVSALNADASTLAGYTGSLMWLILCAATFFLPAVKTPNPIGHLAWHERLGLDALKLLKNSDHRVVFFTIALVSIPLAAFYPHTPAALRAVGLQHTSAWMSLGQLSEIFAMFSLGSLLLRRRLKTIILTGLGFSALRFALSAIHGKAWLLAGVTMHGASYTLVFVTAQIYLEQRVESAWRARAQALMSLMSGGVGNLLGYLGTGWWFNVCTHPDGTQWTVFWTGLTLAVGVVTVYFLLAYCGRGAGEELPAIRQ